VVSREMIGQSPGDQQRLQRSLDWVLQFSLRVLGADRTATDRR
jgi:hypothetical protein